MHDTVKMKNVLNIMSLTPRRHRSPWVKGLHTCMCGKDKRVPSGRNLHNTSIFCIMYTVHVIDHKGN